MLLRHMVRIIKSIIYHSLVLILIKMLNFGFDFGVLSIHIKNSSILHLIKIIQSLVVLHVVLFI